MPSWPWCMQLWRMCERMCRPALIIRWWPLSPPPPPGCLQGTQGKPDWVVDAQNRAKEVAAQVTGAGSQHACLHWRVCATAANGRACSRVVVARAAPRHTHAAIDAASKGVP